MPHPSAHTGPSPSLAIAGLFLVLAPLMARAMSQLTMLPYWDFDPLIFEASMIGMGPAASMTVDAIVLAGAGLCLLATARQPAGRAWVIAGVLAGIGIVPMVYHGWTGPWATIQQQRVGASWVSGMAAMVAIMRLGREPACRATVTACVLGFMAVLALRGAHQMLIEHPMTVETFQRTRTEVFAAQGWSPDSPMARGYERRLTQNEASGWFGLSNVYASFAAMAVAACGALALGWWRGRTGAGRGPLVAAIAAMTAAGGALAMAQSKGGTAAAALGVGVVAALACAGLWPGARAVIARRPAAAGAAAIVLAMLPLGAVAVRGAVGERIGELSILFRWFYLQGATRVALGYEHAGVRVGDWVLGVGPDGFKDAYLIAKNPLSPEEVVSPHSVLFDWWADLGAFGIAWWGVLAIALWRVGRGLTAAFTAGEDVGTKAPDSTRVISARAGVRLVAAVAVVASFASILMHREALTPTLAGVYSAGLVLWAVVSGYMAVGLRGQVVAESGGVNGRLAMLTGAVPGVAAIVLAAHGQIEVTASLPSSVGLWAVMIGAGAAAGSAGLAGAPSARQTGVVRLAGAAVVGLGLLVGWQGVVPAVRWEQGLRAAALEVAPVARARALLGEAEGAISSAERNRLAGLARRELTAVLDGGGGDTPTGDLFARAVAATALRAYVRLNQTWEIPGLRQDWRVGREALRLHAALGDLARDPRADAVRVVGWLTRPGSPWESSAAQALALWMETTTGGRDELRLTWEVTDGYLADAQRLDPWNVLLVWRRLELHRRALRVAEDEKRGAIAGRLEALARRALELDELNRLDPLRRLSREQRAIAERLAKGTAPGPGG